MFTSRMYKLCVHVLPLCGFSNQYMLIIMVLIFVQFDLTEKGY